MKLPIACLLALLSLGCGETSTPADAGRDASVADSGRQDAGPTDDASVLQDGGGSDAGSADAGSPDAGADMDSGTLDAGATDAGRDAGVSGDAGSMRSNLFPQFCPSTVTAPGLYRGTLASNTNDIPSVTGCGSLSTPGPDGSVRIELAPGATVRATYRHAADGVLYILDRCPVQNSCLDGSDGSVSGAETVEWTNTGGETNTIYVVMDSDSLGGPQTFELDLLVTGP